MNEGYCVGNGDLDLRNPQNVTAEYNLIPTGMRANCLNGAFYAFAISKGNGTDHFDNNYASGVSGNNTFLYSSNGFSLGTHNTIGTNPSFANPGNPGPPRMRRLCKRSGMYGSGDFRLHSDRGCGQVSRLSACLADKRP